MEFWLLSVASQLVSRLTSCRESPNSVEFVCYCCADILASQLLSHGHMQSCATSPAQGPWEEPRDRAAELPYKALAIMNMVTDMTLDPE